MGTENNSVAKDRIIMKVCEKMINQTNLEFKFMKKILKFIQAKFLMVRDKDMEDNIEAMEIILKVFL